MIPILGAWVHDIDPFAVRLWGNFGIRWYALSYLLGFALGFVMIRRVVRRGVSTVDVENVFDLVVTIAVGIVVGGRVGYVLFYSPDLLWDFSAGLPFWGALAIHRGGMASHGGIIGGILATLYYARRHGHSWAHLLDLMAFAAPPGVFFGRIANFINGELIGRACPKDFPLAVKFPQEMLDWERYSPSKCAALAEALNLRGRCGDLAARAVEAVQNGPAEVTRLVEPLLTPRHPSQLYAGLLEGLALTLLLGWVWRRPRKPLIIAALFCAAYGVVRIVNELWRRPDMHIADQEFAAFGITRGQWLSVLLLIAGLIMFALAARRPVQRMGGWRPEGE